MKWTQYAVDTVCSGCSGIVVYGGGNIVFGAKRSNQWMQWMQYTVDAVCNGCSRIVVYGGGDIVFGTKSQTSGHSMQWTQWNSGMWWWGHCLWCKKVTSGCSGCSTQWTQYAMDAVE